MPLMPEAAAFLDQLAKQNLPPMETLPIDLTRRAAAIGAKPAPNPPVLKQVQNLLIKRTDGTDLPIRIYLPTTSTPLAACLYFHGGGWVLNSVDTHDDLVRRLAAASESVFVSVEYRLAPEHKYPAAAEDAYTALQWVANHAAELGCNPDRIVMSGDSAGANLATVACLMTRDRNGPKVAHQVLIYPITDCNFETPSYLANAKGYFLTRSEMMWFWDNYVSSPEQMHEAYASPLRAESLHELPPAFVITTEFDPLRDEGEAYAAALRAAGVDATVRRYDGMIHAFMRRVQQFETAKVAIEEVAAYLRRGFHS